MQDLDQNMDDLFRKAAADYPLKLNESQWDDIAPLVEPSRPNSVVAKKQAGLLVIFLSLLLTTGLITNTFKTNKQANPLSSQAENKTYNPGITKETTEDAKDKITSKKQTQQKHYTNQSTLPLLIDYSSLALKKDAKRNKVIENKNDLSLENMPANSTSLIKNKNQTNNNIVSIINPEPIVERNKVEPVKDSIGQIENQPVIKNSNLKKISGRQTGIYLGAVAGPLFDEVKNQGLKKTGFSVGNVAGYQFKNLLALETGLLFAKKPYFTTGKYFNMDKIGNSMPAGMQILSLEGNNYVLEIPVKLKYDFLRRSKSNLFISAGITSYINTNEKNNYLVFLNGSQQSMTNSYKNKSRSLAATFDISAGYEHKIGKSNRIRIEPYLQIPLKGMGVGSMPMMTSGFRIGITKFTN